MAYKYALNAQDAEEITQDVFLKVHDKMNEFRNEAKLETWIYRITINKSIDFLRSKKRQKNQVHQTDNEISIRLASPSQNPAQVLESDESLKHLMHCIHQLPDNQQRALILLKMEQKSQIEVAEIMDTSRKAVESLFQRAKTNLKKLIKETKENE